MLRFAATLASPPAARRRRDRCTRARCRRLRGAASSTCTAGATRAARHWTICTSSISRPTFGPAQRPRMTSPPADLATAGCRTGRTSTTLAGSPRGRRPSPLRPSRPASLPSSAVISAAAKRERTPSAAMSSMRTTHHRWSGRSSPSRATRRRRGTRWGRAWCPNGRARRG